MSGIAVAPAPDLPGYFGKVPMRGDFVTRRLPRSFLQPWDSWLQEAVKTSRERMGADWLQAYLAAPIWRFVLSAGLCGRDPVAGLLMPSMDAVGRYFPFTLARTIPGCVNPAHLAAAGWFHAAEPVLLALRQENYDFDGFDEALVGLGVPDAGSDPGARVMMQSTCWRLMIGPGAEVLLGFPDLIDHLLLERLGSYSLWWNAGFPTEPPPLLVCSELPEVECFAAFLDGDWERWQCDEHSACGPGAPT